MEAQLINRIKTYEKQQLEHVSLANLMHKQHTLVEKKLMADPERASAGRGFKVWTYKDDEAAPSSPVAEGKEATAATAASDAKFHDSDKDDGADSINDRMKAAQELRAKKEKDRIRKRCAIHACMHDLITLHFACIYMYLIFSLRSHSANHDNKHKLCIFFFFFIYSSYFFITNQ